ncbi:MAG: prepilin-type N-terminal cleavage/methylation domain-containing protein [Nitrospira sp.]|nr:prepilin-type N-terminal cleavage/methylation domain-containing protein [Nitrospira sp.]
MTTRLTNDSGFTLIEMLVVLAILAVLTSMAIVFHRHALAKAQSVEAEVVLAEISRLEAVYHANHGVYTDDLKALGLPFPASLKYYKVGIQLDHGGKAFHATALPLVDSGTQLAMVLTLSKDGQMSITKADPAALVLLAGGQLGSNRVPIGDQGVGGPTIEAGGNQSKGNCRSGGEATVAEDGLLDNNFCLK